MESKGRQYGAGHDGGQARGRGSGHKRRTEAGQGTSRLGKTHVDSRNKREHGGETGALRSGGGEAKFIHQDL